MAEGVCALRELREQPRLADPGLAGDGQCRRAAAVQRFEEPVDRLQLCLSADVRQGYPLRSVSSTARASSTRDETPTFRKMFRRWVSTVLTLR